MQICIKPFQLHHQKINAKSLKLTYKIIKPQPNNIDVSKILSARVLFMIKFTQEVTIETLVTINDESSNNINIKNNYGV